MVFRSTEEVHAVFDRWKELYGTYLEEEAPHDHPTGAVNDQPWLSEVLYKSDLRVAPLTTEYNCKFGAPGYLQGKAKILHARPDADIDKMAEVLNRDINTRVYTGAAHRRVISGPVPYSERPYPGPSRTRFLLRRIRHNMEVHGIRSTLRNILSRAPRLLPGNH
ncbi:MAG: hypothetical protein ABEI97_01705 [Candidatus Nanohaloarchaea archaeon]